jgi:hypothetical protein
LGQLRRVIVCPEMHKEQPRLVGNPSPKAAWVRRRSPL